MATERTWHTSSTVLDNTVDLLMTDPIKIETYSVRKGSQVLWAIKESLVGTGNWTVLSCSFRSDATGSSNDTPIPFAYPTQSLTAYGQNAAPVAAGNGVKFLVTGSDMWTTSSAKLATVAGYDNTADLAPGELHRLIYPSFSRTKSPQSNSIVTSSAGRSWILLKNHTDKLSQQGKTLHIVLDYCSSYYATTPVTSSVVSSSATGGKILPTGNFGRSFNFAAFYGEPENIGDITEFQRPYRQDEITFVGVVTGFAYNEWNSFVDMSKSGLCHVNCVWNDDGGSYVVVSQDNVVSYVLGIDPIADSLSGSLSSKASVGNVLFLSHGSITRSDMNRNNNASFPDLFSATRTVAGSVSTNPAENDSWVSPLKYFSTVGAGSALSVPKNLICLLPVIGVNNKLSDTPKPFLTGDNASSGVSNDNTYIEYPVGLVDITNTKWRYAGRFADIKLGPAGGINGTMARDPLTLKYDRFLAGGFWFPWIGDDPIEL